MLSYESKLESVISFMQLCQFRTIGWSFYTFVPKIIVWDPLLFRQIGFTKTPIIKPFLGVIVDSVCLAIRLCHYKHVNFSTYLIKLF